METISAVTLGDRTWFSRHAAVPGAPHSSITQLVQGIWQAEPGQARAILRKRIFTTGELSPMDRGMVKTAAQRVSVVERLEVRPEWQRVSFANVFTPVELSPELVALHPLDLARALAGLARRVGDLYLRDRPVGCVLEAASGERLAWAHNTNRDNRTLHAEVNLLQTLRAPVPPGARLITTLEPCRMCQGMIVSCAPGLRVRYAERDRVPEVPWRLDCAPLDPGC